MMRARRICLLLVAALLLPACGQVMGKITVGYDLAANVENLDPQFAQSPQEQLVIGNLFEGLVTQTPDGEVLPAAAESWQVSADGLRYSFLLRERLLWFQKGRENTPLTAEDFRFGLSRLFDPKALSPHAEDYFAIQNAREIAGGHLTPSQLGVAASGDRELIITLTQKDDFFLKKLAATPAMPCNQEFFETCQGRYGLSKNLLLSNAAFRLDLWEPQDRLTLQKNPQYYNAEAVQINTVELFVDRPEALARFDQGITDIVSADAAVALDFEQQGGNIVAFDGTLWCLAFNQQDDYWSVPLFRQALAYTLDRENINRLLDGSFSPQDSLLGGNIAQALHPGVPQYDPFYGEQLYREGLEFLGVDRLPTVTILVPEGAHRELLNPAQRAWKSYLGISVLLLPLPDAERNAAITNGEYEIVLLPLDRSGGPWDMLENFTGNNRFGYQNLAYDRLVAEIAGQGSPAAATQKARQAEFYPLADAVVIPLYSETSYYLVGKDAQSAVIYPEQGWVRFYPFSENNQ